MQLKDFFLQLSKDDREAFASKCDTTVDYIKQIMYGNRPCKAELAISIDRESNGAVKCEDLCPDADFEYLRGKAAA